MINRSLDPSYSFLIPVYNRPDELRELLTSMTHLEGEYTFEVIVIEDGSTLRSEKIVQAYRELLTIHYIYQDNTGPAGARNTGARVAKGEFLIFLDSDTVLPTHFLSAVTEGIAQQEVDLWGGPDRASEEFSEIQQAIGYSMSSFFTTGGIRGGKRKLDVFYPRSFNMGVRKTVFDAVGGFGNLRFGEDLDFSMRVVESGYRSVLMTQAWVYHKRRVSWRQFFKQVYNSGIARVNLSMLHPGSLKWVHLLPALFVIGHAVILLCVLLGYPGLLILPLAYTLLIVLDVFVRTGWMSLAFNCVLSSYVQLGGYGLGFLHAVWQRIIRKEANFTRFEDTFYQ